MAFLICEHNPPLSSSSSLLPCRPTFHAFLSYADEDNHNNFVNRLRKQLRLKEIHTVDVKNDKHVVEEVRFLVVILSENYISSDRRLDELVKIVDLWETRVQVSLVPIFYDVDPSSVKDQKGTVAEIFACRHDKDFKQEMKKVQRWRETLTKVASICGWDSRDREDKILIEQIVTDMSDRLVHTSAKGTGELVGIYSHVKNIETKLRFESNAAHMVGIWGMGGIGKTTIANVVYDLLSSKFEFKCFLSNVKDNFRKHGAAYLQEMLLSRIPCGKRRLTARAYSAGFSVVKRMCCRSKVLLVLDDVDDWKQLEALAGEPNWFGPGSRIIITTRDKHLLDAHGVKDIYEVKYLQTDRALQLFSQHAFNQKNPKTEYLRLSERLINHAKGLPLALKVLGSSLYDTSITEWQKVQDRLDKIPDLKINDVLKVSFDGLDDIQREVFLDIACFFNGEFVEVARNTLEGCGFFPDIAFAVLKDKALINMENDMKVRMHDLVQEMGHEIVRGESEEPGKRSRLWDPEDIYQVLTKNMGTRAIEAISLDMSKSREMRLETNAFVGMGRLRLLNFCSQKYFEDNKVHFYQDLQYFPNQLRYLHWHGFPLKSFPSNFCPQNLVKLNLPGSKVEQLWTGAQYLENLKEIDLRHCEYLTTIPDLSNARNIKTIDLNGCRSLTEIPSSFQHLSKLENINLAQCKNLIRLPDRIDSECLSELDLEGCSNLKRCPEIFGKLSKLNLSHTAINELPESIEKLTVLTFLDLTGCSSITKFPKVSPNTEILYLGDNAIEQMPSSIQFLTGLTILKMVNNKKLLSLPNSICKLKNLEILDLSDCPGFESFPEILEPMGALTDLYLRRTAIKELPSTIENLNSLSTLLLENCKALVALPSTMYKLSEIRLVDLSYCRRLKALPQLPQSLQVLTACQCKSLETLSTVGKFNLKNVQFTNCLELDDEENSQLAIKAIRSGDETRIIFPGKEIPQWFPDKSIGSLVATQLPLSWNQVKGVAVCVVFELEEPPAGSMDLVSPTEYWIRCKCYVIETDDRCKEEDLIWDWRWYDSDIHLAKSDHVLVWSHPYIKSMQYNSKDEEDWLNKYSGKMVHFEFYFEGYSQLLDVGKCKVKKCGVLVLYNDEEVVPDRTHASQSQPDEEPKAKRLKF